MRAVEKLTQTPYALSAPMRMVQGEIGRGAGQIIAPISGSKK